MERYRTRGFRNLFIFWALIAFVLTAQGSQLGPSAGRRIGGPPKRWTTHLRGRYFQPGGPGTACADTGDGEDGGLPGSDLRLDIPPLGTSLQAHVRPSPPPEAEPASPLERSPFGFFPRVCQRPLRFTLDHRQANDSPLAA